VPIPDLDLQRIKRWCIAETSPAHADELRVEADVKATAVTIVETRPPWDGTPGEWTRDPVARLRYTASTGEWTLYWRDRHLRFHRYARVPATRHVQELLEVIADSGDPIFWG
jgi:hypothetical protein